MSVSTDIEPISAEPIAEKARSDSADFEDNSSVTIQNKRKDQPPAMLRRHDLDALRAVAMLLGIVLHAALSFAPIPWTVQDAEQGTVYEVLFAAIHGFRMPLFFLISGYFTAMLWRRYGLGGLIKQRFKRIVVPLFVGCLTIVPAMWAVSSLAMRPTKGTDQVKVFDAAAKGDTEAVERAIDFKIVEIDALDPNSGAPLLNVATFCGHAETVEMLLRKGADVDQTSKDLATPLHVAVFMGRVESARLLLKAGAKLDTKDGTGNTPIDNLKIDFGTTNFIANMYGQSLDQDELKDARAEIAKLLGEDQTAVNDALDAGPGAGATYGLLFQLPVFMHLWFLAFLCWLIVGFVGYSYLAKAAKFERIPKWLFCSPLSFLWLVPLTMVPQYFMTQETFGPDPSIGLLPIPSVLAYYAIFFFVGAVYWDVSDTEGNLGSRWFVSLPIALFVIFPIGLELVSGTFGFLPEGFGGSIKSWLGNFFQALFAWLMVFGLIGMFRDLLAKENKTIRYLSDSSYWLYLAHLPLVILAQWFVRDLPIPAAIKFVGIIFVVSAFLLVTYEYLVRYTIIGRTLNGKRERPRKNTATAVH